MLIFSRCFTLLSKGIFTPDSENQSPMQFIKKQRGSSLCLKTKRNLPSAEITHTWTFCWVKVLPSALSALSFSSQPVNVRSKICTLKIKFDVFKNTLSPFAGGDTQTFIILTEAVSPTACLFTSPSVKSWRDREESELTLRIRKHHRQIMFIKSDILWNNEKEECCWN